MTGWGTRDEKAFIAGLGTHRDIGQHGEHILPLRKKLARLVSYQRTIPLRYNWGAINKTDIEDFVHDEINRVKRLITQRGEVENA